MKTTVDRIAVGALAVALLAEQVRMPVLQFLAEVTALSCIVSQLVLMGLLAWAEPALRHWLDQREAQRIREAREQGQRPTVAQIIEIAKRTMGDGE